MPTILSEGAMASDWLKAEADGYYSRDTAIIASGSGKLKTGTPLGKLTASGKYVPAAAAGADGSQTAVAVLFTDDVDATSADVKVVIVSRAATASHAGLAYGPTITDAAKRAALNGQLAAVGILVREGA
jgi:hypothetical protein